MNKTLLIVEPMNHIYGVINAAKDMGYSVIVMHNMPLFAPHPYDGAVERIDLAIKIDNWTDIQTLEQQLTAQTKDYDIAGCYVGNEITLPFVAHMQQTLSLPGNPYELVVKYLNKENVRKTLQQHNLTTIQCYGVEEIAQLKQWPFAGSGFFKPVNGTSSTNVKEVHSLEQLHQQMERWQDKSHIFIQVVKDYIEQNNRYFLEQSAKGELLSVESLVFEGEVKVLGLTSRCVLKRDIAIEMGGSFPYQHQYAEQIIEKVIAFHRVLGLRHGPTHTEIMVDEQGNIELVEINLRFPGADSLLMIGAALEIDMAQLLVKQAMNKQLDLSDLHANRFASIQYLLPPQTLTTFESMDFPEGLPMTRVMKKPGVELISTDNQIDHVGGFLASAGSYEALQHKVETIRDQVMINGSVQAGEINNQVLMR